MIEIGKPAPDLSLKNQADQDVRLSDLGGQWVVLYFYPKDNTPGCTVEACEFTAGVEEFAALDAVVLGCSPDTTRKHRNFIDKFDLKISLLSDPDHKVMEKYGAWGEKKMYGRTFQGVKRSTVIIDPSGKVAHHWRSVRARGHAQKVRDKLEALRSG
jgi:peroxiredoxin Q/BCP